MIKTKKLGLLALAMLAVFGVASYANAAALTWSADETVDFSDPDVSITIESGSEATSLVVGTGSLQVVVPSSSTFTMTSTTRDFVFSGDTTSVVSSVCTDTTATGSIEGGGADETVTITLTANTCSSGSGGGGGGGGGSSSTTTPATPAVPATTTPPADCLAGMLFSPSTGKNCSAATPATPAVPASYNFGTMTLKVGSTGAAVMELQRFLNATMNLGLVVDGMFGPLTANVMKQWQTAHGLAPDGLIGPLTKAAMLASLGATPATPAVPATPATPASPSAYNFGTATLKNGSTGEAVKELQRFLNATMNLGLVVDGMFGPKTTAVMKQWQTDHGLVPDGLIGPLTKAQMNASVAQ